MNNYIFNLPDDLKQHISNYLNIPDIIQYNISLKYYSKENEKKINNERYKRIKEFCNSQSELKFRYGLKNY